MIHKMLVLPLLILMGSFVMAEEKPLTLFDFTEAEDHGPDLVVLVNRLAQDAVRRRFGFPGEIEEVRVGNHG